MTDLELLSAYLDDQLAPKDRAQIESRLKTDSKLQRTLADLRAIKIQLRALPTVKPPRSFTLKPENTRSRSAFNWIPVLNWSTAVAAILFAAVISVDLFRAPLSARVEFSAPMQAPAPELAMKAADQQTPITVTPTRTPAAISAVATSTVLAAPGVGAAGLADSPKAATPQAQSLAPAVRSTQPATSDQIATPTPTMLPSPTVTAAPPTHTATAVVIAAPVPAAAQELAAPPWRVPQIILGSILFILIALSFITRAWK
jgi:anti-sigma factor RsiW